MIGGLGKGTGREDMQHKASLWIEEECQYCVKINYIYKSTMTVTSDFLKIQFRGFPEWGEQFSH